MNLTSPDLPPQERLHILEGLALGLSPMHPKDWEAIKSEMDEVQAGQA